MAVRRPFGLNKIQKISNDYQGKWSSFTDRIKNYETPERFKDTFIERWGKYWRNVYLDYQEVVVDVAKHCKTNPIRASIKAGLLGGTYYLAKNNPDEISYYQEFLKNTMRMIPVGKTVRNPIAVGHIKFLEKCYNENVVRYMNLGILSLIWVDDYDNACANYRATCSYLRPRYMTFYQRIIDVGFLNRWWISEERMRDYDVNEEEFKSLEDS